MVTFRRYNKLLLLCHGHHRHHRWTSCVRKRVTKLFPECSLGIRTNFLLELTIPTKSLMIAILWKPPPRPQPVRRSRSQ